MGYICLDHFIDRSSGFFLGRGYECRTLKSWRANRSTLIMTGKLTPSPTPAHLFPLHQSYRCFLTKNVLPSYWFRGPRID